MQVRGVVGGGRFELRRLVGAGACGAVFAAHDRERGREVALKRPHEQVGAPLLRFQREFQALAAIRHPNVVTAHELIAERGRWFFAMELVEGPPLTMAALGVREGFRQLCAAVEALHAAGIVHRDLKPANVRVTPQGRVVVLDLGLAARRGEGEPWSFAGSPSTMAPEQWRGGPALEASDWFAVGALLYERLTGARPFVGEVLEIAEAKAAGRFVRPRERTPGVPPELDAACCALLDPRPERRTAGVELLQRAVAPN